MNLKLLGIGVTLALLSACGRSPLTAEQKEKLSSTLEAAGRPQSSIKDVRNARLGGGRFSAMSNLAGVGSSKEDLKQRRMVDYLKNMKSCEVSYKMDPDFSNGQMPSSQLTRFALEMGMSGQCPAEMNFKIDFALGAKSVDGTMAISYKVNDPSFQGINDVDAMSLNAKMTGDEKGGKFEGSGNIHSLVHGDVKMEISGSASANDKGGDGEIAMLFKFTDFEAELKMKMDGQKAIYSINGEEVTQQEFTSYIQKLFPDFGSMMSNMGGNATNGPVNSGPSNSGPTAPTGWSGPTGGWGGGEWPSAPTGGWGPTGWKR